MSSLVVTRLSKKIGSKSILFDISFAAKSGDVIALLGPNGAGKTTLLKTIIGLHKTPSVTESGGNNIEFNGKCVNNWPVSSRISSGLYYLPQHTSLFQSMTVAENLQLVYEYYGYWKKKPAATFIQERDKWLSYTSLQATLKQLAGSLSGGQKRKLEVVRTLLTHPTIVMLDEPFAGVDPKSIYELKNIFQDMAKNNIGVVISDHHVDQLLSIATQAYVVVKGKIVTSGNIQDVLNCTYTKESYLGTQFYDEITERLLSQRSLNP